MALAPDLLARVAPVCGTRAARLDRGRLDRGNGAHQPAVTIGRSRHCQELVLMATNRLPIYPGRLRPWRSRDRAALLGPVINTANRKRLRLVSFMHYDLGFFDHESSRFECAVNPFEAKVLPMSSE